MPEEKIRINKYLAASGVCSRREADVLVASGRVQCNGEAVTAGKKVSRTDVVTMDGVIVRPLEERIIVAYNKPVGTTCTTLDRHAVRTVYEDVQVFVDDYPVRLSYAGRLDKDSEGLLLFSNDGDFIERLTRAKNGHEKEYLVAVRDVSSQPETLDARIAALREGVFLKDLNRTTSPCGVTPVTGKDAEAFLDGIERVQAAGMETTLPMPKRKVVERKNLYVLRFVLTQGMNRQIRRMCLTKQFKVLRLQRVRVSNILLGDLAPGQWRYLTKEETKGLDEV